jgi:hypothetical protein
MTPPPSLLSTQLVRAVRMAQQVRVGDFQARVHAHYVREATGLTVSAEHPTPALAAAARAPRMSLLGSKQFNPRIMATVLEAVASAGPATRTLDASNVPTTPATQHARRLNERLAALAEIDRRAAELAAQSRERVVPTSPSLAPRSGR